jgi:MFS family permease
MIFGAAQSELMVVGGRMFAGIFTGGAFTAFSNYVVNTSTSENRGANLTTLVTVQNVCGALGYFIGGMLGLVIMFFMIAAATAMNVYKGMSKPHFDGMTQWERDNGKSCKDDDDADDGDEEEDSSAAAEQTLPRRSPVYGVISSVLWALTLGAYLLCSFLTDAWHITWMIFLIATALDNVIKAILDLRR